MILRLELTNPALFPGAQRSRILDGDSLVIGRSPPADWVLPDPERIISKGHCRIERAAQGFMLIDTSVNGVLVNGAPVTSGMPRQLSDGDVLSIGKAVIEAFFETTDVGAAAHPPLAPVALEQAFLAGPFDSASNAQASASDSSAAMRRVRPVSPAAEPPVLQDWWIPDALPGASSGAKSVDIPIVGANPASFVGGGNGEPLSTSGSEVARLRNVADGADAVALLRAVEKTVLILPEEEQRRFIGRLCELLGGEPTR